MGGGEQSRRPRFPPSAAARGRSHAPAGHRPAVGARPPGRRPSRPTPRFRPPPSQLPDVPPSPRPIERLAARPRTRPPARQPTRPRARQPTRPPVRRTSLSPVEGHPPPSPLSIHGRPVLRPLPPQPPPARPCISLVFCRLPSSFNGIVTTAAPQRTATPAPDVRPHRSADRHALPRSGGGEGRSERGTSGSLSAVSIGEVA